MARGPLGPGEFARRLAVLRRSVFPGTEVEVPDVPEGPASVESAYSPGGESLRYVRIALWHEYGASR
jgi:hypothetical protein